MNFTGGCTFNQFAGELWNSRLHQYLIANGIAVVTLNPSTPDSWEWDDPNLPAGAGLDQPFLKELWSSMKAGTYGGVGKGFFNP
eukprot:COSAG04_NODE_372_length_15668_cov_11.135975_6_plen_84_part_00